MTHLSGISRQWDLIVVGGGITGAGVQAIALQSGLKRVLLVEQKDFSWGTSSKSSKLVHGGLRYLKEGRLMLTRESVKERERLLKEAPGLVEPLNFLLPIFKGKGPGRWTMEAGLALYDLLSGKWQHSFYPEQKFSNVEPMVDKHNLVGGFKFTDAQVDDSRLVMRLINQSCDRGGTALNYTRAREVIRDSRGDVRGLVLSDTETGETIRVRTPVIINATGAWAESLHKSPEKGKHLRPLRGGHLVFSAKKVPVQNPVSFFHPRDGRPIFVIPWEGGVILGTTDLDHKQDMNQEPVITREEVLYLTEGLKSAMPGIHITPEDTIASFAGVRPVLSSGTKDPSKESREHEVWIDKGLVTVTGGKLTTFRTLARDTLKAAAAFLGKSLDFREETPVFDSTGLNGKKHPYLSQNQITRLQGRYGKRAEIILKNSRPEDLCEIPGTRTLWAEIPYNTKHEKIRHLDDLLLRRVRVGMLTRQGGFEYLKRVRELASPHLDWDSRRWDEELENYIKLWNRCYAPPV